MKIAVSASGSDCSSLLEARFGRCAYFIIYDTNSKEVKCTENKGGMSGGGAGIAAAQQVIDENVDVVITGNLGPNALNLFKTSGIKVFKCGTIEVEAAIELLQNGKLEELTEAGPSHAGFGMGNGKMFRGGL